MELSDFADFLHELPETQWDAPSLCEGWKVRDVVSHLAVGYTVPLATVVGQIAKYRGNVNKASDVISRAFGRDHSPTQILAAFDAGRARPRGVGRIEKPHEALVDALPRAGGLVASKKRVAGLRLVATDVDHVAGDGPEVRGTAEALALVATGRVVALDELDELDELDGDGVEILRTSIEG